MTRFAKDQEGEQNHATLRLELLKHLCFSLLLLAERTLIYVLQRPHSKETPSSLLINPFNRLRKCRCCCRQELAALRSTRSVLT